MRLQMSDLLGDLFMFLVYIVTLYWVVLGTRDSLAYHSTKTLRDVVIVSENFKEIKSGKMFIDFMSEHLIPALHKEELYNGQKINDTGTTAIYDVQLLGVLRLRQLRVKNGTCVATDPLNCNLGFSLSNEDVTHHGISWGPYDEKSFRATRATVPWLYRGAWSSGTVPVQGEFALYPGGGYTCTLGRTMENSQLVFQFLVRYSWFDRLTRAVFIDFTTYNANRNLFNIVTLLVEMSAEGSVALSEDIKTLELLVHYHTLGLSMLVAVILWLLTLLVFTCRQLVRVQRVSLRAYFSSWWNVIDLLITLLGLSSVVLYFLRSQYASSLLHHLDEADGNEFVNFTWAAYWQIQLDYVVGVLVCLSTARLWKLLRFGHQFRSMERTLVLASKTLLPLTFMLVIFLLGFAGFALVFVGHVAYDFSSLYNSFSTMFFYSIGYSNLDQEKFFNAHFVIGPFFVLLYWLVFFIYFINLFVTIINLAYEYSQEVLSSDQEEYKLLNYLRDEFKYFCTWKKVEKKENIDVDINLLVKEKYQHYLRNKEPSETQNNDGNTMHKEDRKNVKDQDNSDEKKVVQTFMTFDENLPSNIFQYSTIPNTNSTVTKNERLRAGSDGVPGPVSVPAVAIPKPDAIRMTNAKVIPGSRMERMRLLALAKLYKARNHRDLEMAALTLDMIEKGEGGDEEEDSDVFYLGLDGDREVIVPDVKLLEMEMFVNKLGAEKFCNRRKENEVHNIVAEDEEVELEIEETIPGYREREISVPDILGFQMDRLMNLILNIEGGSDVDTVSVPKVSKISVDSVRPSIKKMPDEQIEQAKLRIPPSLKDLCGLDIGVSVISKRDRTKTSKKKEILRRNQIDTCGFEIIPPSKKDSHEKASRPPHERSISSNRRLFPIGEVTERKCELEKVKIQQKDTFTSKDLPTTSRVIEMDSSIRRKYDTSTVKKEQMNGENKTRNRDFCGLETYIPAYDQNRRKRATRDTRKTKIRKRKKHCHCKINKSPQLPTHPVSKDRRESLYFGSCENQNLTTKQPTTKIGRSVPEVVQKGNENSLVTFTNVPELSGTGEQLSPNIVTLHPRRQCNVTLISYDTETSLFQRPQTDISSARDKNLKNEMAASNSVSTTISTISLQLSECTEHTFVSSNTNEPKVTSNISDGSVITSALNSQLFSTSQENINEHTLSSYVQLPNATSDIRESRGIQTTVLTSTEGKEHNFTQTSISEPYDMASENIDDHSLTPKIKAQSIAMAPEHYSGYFTATVSDASVFNLTPEDSNQSSLSTSIVQVSNVIPVENKDNDLVSTRTTTCVMSPEDSYEHPSNILNKSNMTSTGNRNNSLVSAPSTSKFTIMPEGTDENSSQLSILHVSNIQHSSTSAPNINTLVSEIQRQRNIPAKPDTKSPICNIEIPSRNRCQTDSGSSTLLEYHNRIINNSSRNSLETTPRHTELQTSPIRADDNGLNHPGRLSQIEEMYESQTDGPNRQREFRHDRNNFQQLCDDEKLLFARQDASVDALSIHEEPDNETLPHMFNRQSQESVNNESKIMLHSSKYPSTQLSRTPVGRRNNNQIQNTFNRHTNSQKTEMNENSNLRYVYGPRQRETNGESLRERYLDDRNYRGRRNLTQNLRQSRYSLGRYYPMFCFSLSNNRNEQVLRDQSTYRISSPRRFNNATGNISSQMRDPQRDDDFRLSLNLVSGNITISGSNIDIRDNINGNYTSNYQQELNPCLYNHNQYFNASHDQFPIEQQYIDYEYPPDQTTSGRSHFSSVTHERSRRDSYVPVQFRSSSYQHRYPQYGTTFNPDFNVDQYYPYTEQLPWERSPRHYPTTMDHRFRNYRNQTESLGPQRPYGRRQRSNCSLHFNRSGGRRGVSNIQSGRGFEIGRARNFRRDHRRYGNRNEHTHSLYSVPSHQTPTDVAERTVEFPTQIRGNSNKHKKLEKK
ncbi:uncharacterized protein [Periplaneta americana]|uniref:uncharacterized protein n=1 Tax=Periplaneta americana TaxID=6978 RepID=UPI0037E94A55